jgi:hypothetical protein
MIIQCSECKKEISGEASACPHCGADYSFTLRHLLLLTFKVFFVLGFIAFLAGVVTAAICLFALFAKG